MIIVTAALIFENNCLFVGKRSAEARQAGLWEFPGGKVEPGEDPRAGLKRELLEELNVEAEVEDVVETIFHSYEFDDVLLLFYKVKLLKREPQDIVHAETRWQPVDKLAELEFLPADVEFIRNLSKGKYVL